MIAKVSGPRRPKEQLTDVELRLFLEELCSELCRFHHIAETGRLPEEFLIEREVPLAAELYADLHIQGPGVPPYFVEIKYGMTTAEILARLSAKYAAKHLVSHPVLSTVQRLVVVLARQDSKDEELLARLQQAVSPTLRVEIWDEQHLLSLVQQHLHIERQEITAETLLDIRDASSRVKGFHAFGGVPFDRYENDALREQLLWRFAYWRLRQLRENHDLLPRQILPPGEYAQVAVVIADLCSFSSFVRDSPDDRVVRESLTSFFSKARYEVVHRGGMLENFVGDQILALFGIPDQRPGYIEDALAAAKALQRVGTAVSENWQRQIDRVQPSTGIHIGVAFGDINIMPLRPSSRTHTTAIADVINVGARLMNIAGPGEMLVSNSFFLHLRPESRSGFVAMEPQEARNVGRLKAWRHGPDQPTAFSVGTGTVSH